MAGAILTPIDFSEGVDQVVEQAAMLASALDADLLIIHVAPAEPVVLDFEGGAFVDRDLTAANLRAQHRRLDDFREQLNARGIRTTTLLVPGQPMYKIVEEAEKRKPRMIVMGSHGHGALFSLLMGSVCEHVMRNVDCPVMIVPVREAGEAENRKTG